MGGVFGAIGGYLLYRGGRAMEQRVLIGEAYYKRRYEKHNFK